MSKSLSEMREMAHELHQISEENSASNDTPEEARNLWYGAASEAYALTNFIDQIIEKMEE